MKGTTRLKAIDLFCGAGGLTLGLKQAGFKVIGAIEVNPIAHSTYIKNHEEVECLLSDIRSVDATKWMHSLDLQQGELSLLAGCPPCQGFSTLRTRKKTNSVSDDRNDLIWDYLRFVEAFLPQALMLENVPALLKDSRMNILLQKLQKLGYIVGNSSVCVEDASDFGVPQRRKRMIMKLTRFSLLEQITISKKVTVRECFQHANLPPVGMSGDALHDFIPKRSEKVQELIRSIPKDGGSRSELPEHLILECHKNISSGFTDVYGRMAWDEVSPTITGGCASPSKGRFLHPEEDRGITLREAALLQTFPKDYWFSTSGGRSAVALMIGNALPPEFIKQHALAIANSLNCLQLREVS